MTVPEITPERLRDDLAAGRAMTIVDVRPAAERAEWSIPGSVHVDAYRSLWDGDRSVLVNFAAALPKSRPVVTVCAKGRTSAKAAALLQELGFDAYSLASGMAGWTGAWNVAEVGMPDPQRASVLQVRRIGKGCLSYLVGSAGQAAVIDPSIDPAVYESLAAERGWRIVAVLDTHVHADHVTRAYDLAGRCGAPVYLPAQQRVTRPFTPLHDGDEVPVGAITLRALRTPGHTKESTSFLIADAALCSGDTLFLNTVGRPDLAAVEAGEPRERAAALYRSVRDRLLALDDDVMVLPGHSSIALPFDGVPHAARVGTVRAAVTLMALDEAAFVDTVLSRIPETPPNHMQIVRINEGREPAPSDMINVEAGANRCAIAQP